MKRTTLGLLRLKSYISSFIQISCIYKATVNSNMKVIVVVDHRAFEFSLREGKIFRIKSMNFRAINRIVHYGIDIGSRQALIDLNDDDEIEEHSKWKAIVQDGCYGIFRPTTPAPSTTTTTTATTTVSIGKKVRKY